MDEEAIGRILDAGGVIGALGLALWVFYTERVVPRGRLTDAEKDRDEWRKQAHMAGENSERLTLLIQRLLSANSSNQSDENRR